MTNYSLTLSTSTVAYPLPSIRLGHAARGEGRGFRGPQVTILLGGVLYPKTGCGGEDEVVVVVLQLYYMV